MRDFIIILSVIAVSSAQKIDWGKNQDLMTALRSVIKCQDGSFTGFDNVAELIDLEALNCSAPAVETEDSFWAVKCLMKNIDLVDSDGKLDFHKLDGFLSVVYSREILYDIESIPRNYHRCIKEYAFDTSNSGSLTLNPDYFETLMACFELTARKHQHFLKVVCEAHKEYTAVKSDWDRMRSKYFPKLASKKPE